MKAKIELIPCPNGRHRWSLSASCETDAFVVLSKGSEGTRELALSAARRVAKQLGLTIED